MTTAVAEDRMAAIEARLDAISEQLAFVAAALREQDMRRGQWDELRRDLAPVATEAFDLVSRELDEVRHFVQPADLLRVSKRLLRDLPYLEAMLDQAASLSQLGGDLAPLGREMVTALMARLHSLEQRGYFDFARGGLGVLDRVVTSFAEEDLHQLGDNVVLILRTVKELTQPEVMGLLQRTALQVRRAPDEELGLFRLAWRLRRPEARRGLARAFGVLESLGSAEGPHPAETQPTDDQQRNREES